MNMCKRTECPFNDDSKQKKENENKTTEEELVKLLTKHITELKKSRGILMQLLKPPTLSEKFLCESFCSHKSKEHGSCTVKVLTTENRFSKNGIEVFFFVLAEWQFSYDNHKCKQKTYCYISQDVVENRVLFREWCRKHCWACWCEWTAEQQDKES